MVDDLLEFGGAFGPLMYREISFSSRIDGMKITAQLVRGGGLKSLDRLQSVAAMERKLRVQRG